MRILALDGGKAHFAYASVEVRDNTCSIEDLGLLNSPMSDLTAESVSASADAFMTEMHPLILGSDRVVFERVIQQPNRTSGSSVEYIGVSLGMILAECRDLNKPLVPVMASTWKPMTKRRFVKWTSSAELFDQPPVVKNKKSNIVSDHEYDALGIALWYTNKLGVPFNEARQALALAVANIISERTVK